MRMKTSQLIKRTYRVEKTQDSYVKKSAKKYKKSENEYIRELIRQEMMLMKWKNLELEKTAISIM